MGRLQVGRVGPAAPHRTRGRGGQGRLRPAPDDGLCLGQAFALGPVEEVATDVVPVVCGSGKRYFGPARSPRLLEDPYRVVQGDRVLHLRHRVRR